MLFLGMTEDNFREDSVVQIRQPIPNSAGYDFSSPNAAIMDASATLCSGVMLCGRRNCRVTGAITPVTAHFSTLHAGEHVRNLCHQLLAIAHHIQRDRQICIIYLNSLQDFEAPSSQLGGKPRRLDRLGAKKGLSAFSRRMGRDLWPTDHHDVASPKSSGNVNESKILGREVDRQQGKFIFRAVQVLSIITSICSVSLPSSNRPHASFPVQISYKHSY